MLRFSWAAYGAFLQSLAHAGFDKGDKDPALKDERGYCPLGNRYIYEIVENKRVFSGSGLQVAENRPLTRGVVA